MDNNIIYLDYQATTPCDARVLEKMLPFFNLEYGNPHSKNHALGWHAEEAVELARKQVADSLKATAKDIIFTSGATEANNMIFKGLSAFFDNKKHIIVSNIEHKCVLENVRHLEQLGYSITYLPVDNMGIINLDDLKNAIGEQTLLVSVMAVNNEIGVIQDLEAIGKICEDFGVFFHTDAAQALGKIDLDVDKMRLDLVSLSAHKFYGPKGVGALYARRKNLPNKPRLRLVPLMHGGGQERGMRSGTLPTALCVGMGEAAKLAIELQRDENEHLMLLRNLLNKNLLDNLPKIYVNGCLKRRIAGNLNISFAGVEGESLIMKLKDLALSSGSACTSSSLEPSYVLHALGVSDELAHTSLRIGLGRFTTQEQVLRASNLIIDAVDQLRKISPLWEMMEQGVDLKSLNWSHP